MSSSWWCVACMSATVDVLLWPCWNCLCVTLYVYVLTCDVLLCVLWFFFLLNLRLQLYSKQTFFAEDRLAWTWTDWFYLNAISHWFPVKGIRPSHRKTVDPETNKYVTLAHAHVVFPLDNSYWLVTLKANTDSIFSQLVFSTGTVLVYSFVWCPVIEFWWGESRPLQPDGYWLNVCRPAHFALLLAVQVWLSRS
jgi:hypothetical protein